MFAKGFLLYQQEKAEIVIAVPDLYGGQLHGAGHIGDAKCIRRSHERLADRKSTRLNSSHT